jgi:hypothetical protein
LIGREAGEDRACIAREEAARRLTSRNARRIEMTMTITATDEAASFATYEAISATLQHYIDGAHRGDGSLMRRAFLESAHIRGSYGGKPVEWTLEAFCALIDKGGGAPGLKARVVAIEHEGSAAMARLEAENWRGTRYTDFFVLVLRDNAWKIASKVFFAHSKA